MSSYICSRCNYTTKRKSNFKHHITRKNICKPVNSDTPIKIIAESYGIDISTTDINVGNEKVMKNGNEKVMKNGNEKVMKNGKYICKGCNKRFNSCKTLEIHMKRNCKMLVNFNNIYKFDTKTFGKHIFSSTNKGGDIYIIQTDYVNNNIFKIGRTTNLYNRIRDYRCSSTYEPRLYYYYPFSDIITIDSKLKLLLENYNLKREIYKGDLNEIRNIIKNLQVETDGKEQEYEPEIKCEDLCECEICKKVFYSNIESFAHREECNYYKDKFESQNVTIRHHCDYCNKSFATIQGKYRHKKHCKYIKDKTNKRTYTQDEIEKIKQEADKKAELKIKEVEEKYEVLADKKAQKMVLSLVDKLMPNQTTNSHNTNSHNTNTQNNTLINNNNNLKINNFGKEKTKYITDDKLKIMFVDPRNVVVQHIKDTYYHVLHPENFNAKITNCKSKHMHIFKENDWEKVNKQLTICSMYNKHEKIIENEFERLKPELTDTVRDNYNEYKKSTLHSFSTFKHRMIDIEAVIINGTNNHKKIDILSEKEVARLAKEQGKTPGEIFAEHMPDIFAERDGFIDD
jgi:hypothetical protein